MIEIFRITGGFGYRVEESGLKILQPHLPAVGGKIAMSREQAERLSRMVETKMKATPGTLPTLSVEEVLT